MQTVKINDLLIGDGLPKICVSLGEKTGRDVIESAKQLATSATDVIEWRLDYLDANLELEAIGQLANELRALVSNKPLLLTFRTLREGGQRALDVSTYLRLYDYLLDVVSVSVIDLEFAIGMNQLEPLVAKAKSKDVKVILSHHNFLDTPAVTTMKELVIAMEASGADIAKLAVMPKTPADVLALMALTEELSRRAEGLPLITMSMGELGKLSRVAGKLSGSAVTFGALGEVSAPGQLALSELRKILDSL